MKLKESTNHLTPIKRYKQYTYIKLYEEQDEKQFNLRFQKIYAVSVTFGAH